MSHFRIMPTQMIVKHSIVPLSESWDMWLFYLL